MSPEFLAVAAIAAYLFLRQAKIGMGTVPVPVSGPKPPVSSAAPDVNDPSLTQGQSSTVLNIGQQTPSGGLVLSVGIGPPVKYDNTILAAGSLVKKPDGTVETAGAIPALPTAPQTLSTGAGIVTQSLATAQQSAPASGVTWVPQISQSANGPITILVPRDAQGNNLSGIYGTITPA